MVVLLTRPQADSARIAEALNADGIETMIWPLSRIVPLANAVSIPDGTEAVIFTSANAVRTFSTLSAERNLPAICVGVRTAQVARDAGFADTRICGGDARSLADTVANSPMQHFFYPRGRETATDLAEDLRCNGKIVVETILYGSDPSGPPSEAVNEALETGRIGVITVWSRRNAEVLCRQIIAHPGWRLAGTDLIAISQSASEPLEETPFRRILVSPEPNADAMKATISAALRQ